MDLHPQHHSALNPRARREDRYPRVRGVSFHPNPNIISLISHNNLLR
jgi:hypothetical protein